MGPVSRKAIFRLFERDFPSSRGFFAEGRTAVVRAGPSWRMTVPTYTAALGLSYLSP